MPPSRRLSGGATKALSDLDFSEGAPAEKLTMAGGNVFAGNAASKFEPAKPFAFLPAEDK